jgi:hypothetical protein
MKPFVVSRAASALRAAVPLLLLPLLALPLAFSDVHRAVAQAPVPASLPASAPVKTSAPAMKAAPSLAPKLASKTVPKAPLKAAAPKAPPSAPLLALPASTSPANAGTDPMVKNRLRQIALGNAAAVREEMPTLLARYKNDAGVDFLNASVQSDPEKANAVFERIVRTMPKNSWADDAQWRVVQFYTLRKDTSRARAELQNFRRDYPNSEFLLFASEMVKSSVGLPASFAGRSASSSSAVAAAASEPASSQAPPELARGESVRSESARGESARGGLTEKTDGKLGEKLGSSAAVPAPASAPMTAPDTASEQRYTLQIGVFASEQNAALEVQKLIKARMRADVVEKRLGDQVRFAVVVGDYSTRANAEKARALVQKYTKTMPIVVPKPPAFSSVQ